MSSMADAAKSMAALRTSSTAPLPSLRRGRAAAMKVYSVSDLHVDHVENERWVHAVEDHGHDSCLLVAGDVSGDAGRVAQTLASLRSKFGRVFFVPGNHDLWLSRHEPYAHSMEKLEALGRICANVGVDTRPGFLGQGDPHPCCIVPLHSWYSASFDTAPDLPGPLSVQPIPASDLVVDSFRCLWPLTPEREQETTGPRVGSERRATRSPSLSHVVSGQRMDGSRPELNTLHERPRRCPEGTEVSHAMDKLNEDGWDELVMAIEMESPQMETITFSHFLPRPELLPEKRFLLHPNLPRVVGSTLLGDRVGALRPALHVFGHTHFVWDMVLDGTRYVQWPLASPREQQRRKLFSKETEAPVVRADSSAPLLLFDTQNPKQDTGVCMPEVESYWCDWYQEHPREPGSNRLAPYSAMLYRAAGDERLLGEVEDRLPGPIPGHEDEAAELLWRDMQRASPKGVMGGDERKSPTELLYPSSGIRTRSKSMHDGERLADSASIWMQSPGALDGTGESITHVSFGNNPPSPTSSLAALTPIKATRRKSSIH